MIRTPVLFLIPESVRNRKQGEPAVVVDRADLSRLLVLGKEQGYVSLDQIKEILPVDEMSSTEIADVIDQLEQADISVEIDKALLVGRGTIDRPPADIRQWEPPPSKRTADPTVSKVHSLSEQRRSMPGRADATGSTPRGSRAGAFWSGPLFWLPVVILAAIAAVTLIAALIAQ